MRFTLAILICFFCNPFLHAQHDTIYFVDGAKVISDIQEMTESTVKYRKADNPEGPVYVIHLSEISTIAYRNGRRENFGKSLPAMNAPERPQRESTKTKTYQAKNISDNNGPVHYQGPRIGMTYIGEGTIATSIINKGKQPIVSQFGWQFETRIFTSRTGLSGLAEFIPLIGGMEQGMFIPSATFLFGLRLPKGFEIAFGPNLAYPSGLGMVLAIGTSFHYDDVYFPVNLAFIPSVTKSTTETTWNGKKVVVREDTGFRVSLFVGFNTRKN